MDAASHQNKKKMMIPPPTYHRLLLALTLLLVAASQQAASQAPHYLGTQNMGNQQVFLFRLPKSMISGPLEEQAAQQQQQQQLPQPQSQVTTGQYGRLLQQQHQQQQVSQEPAALVGPDQSLSLQIPLSALRAAAVAQQQQQQQQQQHQQPQQTPQQEQQFVYAPAQPRLFQDYTAVEANRQQQPVAQEMLQQQQVDPLSLTEPTQAELDQQYGGGGSSSSSLAAAAADQGNLIEQQMRHFLRSQATPEQNYSHPALMVSGQQQELQPQLWVETQKQQQQQQQPSSSQSYQYQFQQQQHQQLLPLPTATTTTAMPLPLAMASQNNTDSGVLLERLAHSSPELLLRLRSLLRRAAKMSRDPTTTSTSQQQVQEAAFAQVAGDPRYSLASLADRSQLGAYLANDSLSSHEELKIPLVVIAVPRVLSLKRSQLARSVLLADERANLTRALTASNLVQLSQESLYNNNTANSSYVSPAHYTMAPYARQFSPQQQQQQQQQFQQLLQLQQQLPQRSLESRNQSELVVATGGDPLAASYAVAPTTSAAAATNRTLLALEEQLARLKRRLAAQAQAPRPYEQVQAELALASGSGGGVALRGPPPSYAELRASAAPYLASAAAYAAYPPALPLVSAALPTTVPAYAPRLAAALPALNSTTLAELALEARLARLRPLFTAGEHSRSGGDLRDQLRAAGNKLSVAQMLSLMGRDGSTGAAAAAKRSSMDRRSGLQAPALEEQHHQKKGARREAKMVVMIV